MSVSMRLPPFAHAVSSVVLVCAAKQVRKITANWVVAPVTDYETAWNLSKVQHPTDAVSPVNLRVREPKASVSTLLVPCPRPAFIWSSFIHKAPKARLGFFVKLCQKALSLVRIHRADLVRVLWPDSTTTAPALFTGLGLRRQR
jgi:hypothetical protein